jgi:hypothetical protein
LDFARRCQQVKKTCAHFWRSRAKKQAFRSNSSDLPMQILRDFRFNPLRPTGLSGFGTTSLVQEPGGSLTSPAEFAANGWSQPFGLLLAHATWAGHDFALQNRCSPMQPDRPRVFTIPLAIG